LHLRLHREDDALHDLERCLAAVPKAALCVQLQMDIHSGRLECEAAEKDARQWQRLRPDLDAPFRALADVLAAEGKPLAAIEELLHRASEAKEMSTSDALPRSAWDPVHLATYTGDLGEAARAASDLAARVDKDSRDLVHAEPAEALIRLYTEMGEPSRAAAAARSYLDRRDAFSADLRPIDTYGHFSFEDITLVSLGAVVRAGGMKKDDFLHRRRERETLLRAAWHDDWAIWCWRASGIETEEEAHETLDTLPEVPVAPGGVDDESDPGRALVLAGRIDEAIVRLENSISVCRGLTMAFRGTRSAYFLGMAREAKGNRDGACDAYRIVVSRWGHAKPRSVTGERALARARALGCPP
jgi:tetratricopeptide (TPR) repeat protein